MPLLRDLAEASLRLYGELAQTDGAGFGFVRRGLFMLFNSTAGERHALEEARLAKEIGVPVRILDRSGLERLDPGIEFRAVGGTYFPGDAHIDPVRFVSRLEAEVRRLGASILSGVEILGFRIEGTRVAALRTSAGEIEGDEFVLAAGSWSPELLRGLRSTLPMQPGKGYSVTFASPSIAPSIPSILTEARVAVTPLAGRLRLAGTMELAGMNPSVNMRRVEAIVRAVPRYYGGFDPRTGERSRPWYGFRPCSPDGLPYLGRLSAHPNLIVATGHAMIGISLGPITGRIVADLVAGRSTDIDLTLLSPDRYL
jgi:D-amino-acid dehydrogenase